MRRTSNGIENFSDYFNSPRKDPSVSPIQSSKKRPHDEQIPQRVRNDRPDMFHEIGERGRKTGISPPKNSVRDENGFEDFENYLIKATEQTNKGIARERRKSMRRKSINQPLHARKLSVATFVDDGDDDEEFLEESMSLDTPDASALYHQESHSMQSDSGPSNQIHPDQRKTRSGLSDAIDQSIRTPDGSDLIDFDVVPEGPIHSTSRHKSQDEQPMTVQEDEDQEDEEDDVQNSGGMPANEYDDDSVASDGFDPPPPPPEESVEDPDMGNPAGLEDIVEAEEEDDQDISAGPSGHADSSNAKPAEPPKPRKRNPNPPPPAGVRRGERHRFARLAHWRGERVVYGRSVTPDGTQKVIGMVDVVRVPTEPPESFAARRSRRGAATKIKSESVAPRDICDHLPPEEGWDSETLPNAIVYSASKQKDVERVVACTKKMVAINVDDQAGMPNAFQFQRVFKQSDFSAGGLMLIPPGGGKPLKPSKDNCYFFTVLEGAVSVHIHRTTFVMAPQGVFCVPPGNVYSIRNISERTAKLTFSQSRRVTDADSEVDSDEIDPEHSILQSGLNNPSTSTTIPSKARHHSQPDQSPTDPAADNPKTKKKKAPQKDTSATSTNPPARKKKKTVLAMKKRKKTGKQKQKEEEQPAANQPEKEEEKEEQGEQDEEEEEEEEAQSSS